MTGVTAEELELATPAADAGLDVAIGSVSDSADAVIVAGDWGEEAGDALVDAGTKVEVVDAQPGSDAAATDDST